jgi:eukaryotic-like serine/threonine-protein kinase
MSAGLHEVSERMVDRYAIYEPIATGGMAVVHFGRLLGQAGFSRTVAIKRLHPQFAADPDFVAMFLDEARLAVRVQHPNVVAPLDVVVADGELLVVMDYVSGETLSQLMRQSPQRELAPPPVIARVLVDALYGLHAAHEAVAEDGSLLEIVHRDISPQNIIVGVDGVARVLDFGVAKAAMRSHATKDGEIKGKIAYMAPEQLKSMPIDRRADLFAAGVVLWECLTGQRLFRGDDLGQTVERVLHSTVAPPSALNPAVPPELDAVVLRALERAPGRRFQTAREQAAALGAAIALASPSQVADWVRELGGARLSQRIERVAAIESRSSSRLKVTGRSPLHTPLGFTALSAPSSSDSPGSGERRSNLAALGHGRDDVPTVRPAPEEPSSSVVGSSELGSRPTSTRRAKLMLGAVGAVALAAGVAISWLARGPSSPAPHAAPRSEPAASLPAPRVSVPPVEVALDSPPDAASEAPSASAGKPPKSRGIARTGAVKASASAPKAAAKAASNCSPPFIVDERGIRRIKPECR